jgi:hypothetical protein
MKKMQLIGAMILFEALFACGSGLVESDIPFAPAMLDNALAGIAERDYGKFSKDFSTAMKDGVSEESFPSVAAAVDEKLGAYRGRTFLSAGRTRTAIGVITIVTYLAVYSKDDDARIRIWISEKDGVRRIEGFLACPAGELK